MSHVVICGRLGRDSELREVGGDQVLNFSVAENIGFGEKKRTQWWSCALWGKRGEKLAQYLTKGTSVTVIGNEATVREYQAKDGTAKFELTCRVVDVTLQGGGAQREEQEVKPARESPPVDDDIPF